MKKIFPLLLSLLIISCDKQTSDVFPEVTDVPDIPDTPMYTIDFTKNFEMVNLGLPSGTLWANMNIGASSNAEPGGYYSWGELVEFGEHEYSFFHQSQNLNEGESYYISIGDNICGTKYDIATKILGSSYSMPSIEQFMELADNCVVSEYNLSGIEGYIFVGKNGNKIFLPEGGSKSHAGSVSGNVKVTHHSYPALMYWSGSLITNKSDWPGDEYGGAWAFNQKKYRVSRDLGLNIRAVSRK